MLTVCVYIANEIEFLSPYITPSLETPIVFNTSCISLSRNIAGNFHPGIPSLIPLRHGCHNRPLPITRFLVFIHSPPHLNQCMSSLAWIEITHKRILLSVWYYHDYISSPPPHLKYLIFVRFPIVWSSLFHWAKEVSGKSADDFRLMWGVGWYEKVCLKFTHPLESV